MTSGSDSSEPEPEEDKINKQMKGVEDEDALRQLVMSDDSDEEENKEENKDEEKNGNRRIFEEVSFWQWLQNYFVGEINYTI